jgi:hypothetical protein
MAPMAAAWPKGPHLRRSTAQLGGGGTAVHGGAMGARNRMESERWLQKWPADREDRWQTNGEETGELASVGH